MRRMNLAKRAAYSTVALVIDEMALRRSVIFNEGRLKHEEKLFLDMVKSGDILNLRQLTQNHPDLNVNCLDFRGRGALEIAVRCRDPHMVQELLGHPKIETELVYKAVLVAIEENMIDEVSTLLDSPAALRAAAERPSEYPNILVDNMCPIVQAALLDRLDITKLLLDKGHHIEKPHPRQCKCELRCANADYHEELSESQVELNSLRGLASPTYLVLTSPDPILTAFYMSRDLKTEAIERPEFREELLQLSQQCEHFAAELLDQCQTSEEVQTVLSQTQGFPDSRPFRFPRLYLAILLQQKQFVARPNCQQVLHTLWMSGIPQWYSWSFYRRFFHIFTQVLFTPLLCLTFLIYPRAKLLHVFRVPMNKFIHHLTLYLIFLSLILITLFYGRRDQFRFRALWSEVLVGIFVVGYVWELMLSMYTLGFRIFMRSLWSVYQLVMFFLFLVAEILYLVVFATSRTIRDNLQRELWPWYHPYLIGEALYAIATVMAFCRLLQLCQLSKIIGPLSISLNRMTGDIFRFMIILLIVFVAFCAGLNSVYKNYNGNVLRIRGIRNVTQPAAFVSVGHTLKSLFWGIYAMGSPTDADLVVSQNIGSADRILKHYFTEAVGYGLWALFHILTVIVLLNMLIAMMSDSFQRIQENAYQEWMFARASQWIQYFDNHTAIPAPFNLLPSAYCINQAYKIGMSLWEKEWRRAREQCSPEWACFPDFEQARELQKRYQHNYQSLIIVLIRRYLQLRELEERDHALSRVLSSFLSTQDYSSTTPGPPGGTGNNYNSNYNRRDSFGAGQQVKLRHPSKLAFLGAAFAH
ncbi:short transient receptor potential channel 5-like isoform X2 [Varroa destructor]|uniref:Transient receptor ion channel domain-containing protein n=1 Tax=Varroa destructor TaxID=109461 RepID=A0A7M7K6S6_VARDE|nr:short transient receptor potential channel 5-like isoform X2 [Varroa destructor]